MEIEDLLLYSKPKVIGSGTLPADPSLSWRKGLWINSADGLPFVSVRSFLNVGNDAGNWGKPTWRTTKTRPSVDEFDIFVTALITANANFSPIITDGIVNADTTFQIAHNPNTSVLQVISGGVRLNGSSHPTGVWNSYYLKSRIGSNNSEYGINGTKVTNFTTGSFVNSATDVIIGGIPSLSDVMNGRIGIVSFKKPSGDDISTINFNNPIQWDGGLTAISSSGDAITFTDNSPTGIVGYNWIKYSDAKAWGLI